VDDLLIHGRRMIRGWACALRLELAQRGESVTGLVDQLVTPLLVTAEIARNTTPRAAKRRVSSCNGSGEGRRSILLATTICGLAARVASKWASSRLTTSKSSSGSRPLRPPASRRWISKAVRERWRRNRWPRPWPSCAPSMSRDISQYEASRFSVANHAQLRHQGREG